LTETPSDVQPLAPAAVIRLAGPKDRRMSTMRWGLVPPWAPDLGFGVAHTLAGAERVATRLTTRQAMRRRRCLIPASAFIERKVENGRLRQVRTQLKEGGPFAFAGLWESWRSPLGEEAETFAVIAVAPSNTHPNGFPVVFDPRDYALWLDPEPRQFDRQLHLLRPPNEKQWQVEAVRAKDEAERLRSDYEDLRRRGLEARQASAALRHAVRSKAERMCELTRELKEHAARFDRLRELRRD
jgi:putative SOS response-associated peptidase YedK